MNGENPFEKRLQGLPQRPVPPAWRQEILSAARQMRSGQPDVVTLKPLISRFNVMVAELLWPNPRAWAGLAALWVVVLGLSFANRESTPPGFARQSALPSPQMRELLRQQEQLMAELVGPNGTTEHDLPRPAAPRSQGGRREDFVNA
jgi:hypothetical protein